MKKKALPLLLALAILLTACAAAPPPDPTAPTYAQNVEATDGHIRIGKFHADLPDSFKVYETTDNAVYLVSHDNFCVIGLYAFDVSDYSETEIAQVIADQKPTDYDATETETTFADMDLISYLWVELDANLKATGSVQTTFTDSWYLYQINVNHLPGYEESNVMHDSITFLMSFEADDVPARFDFVQ